MAKVPFTKEDFSAFIKQTSHRNMDLDVWMEAEGIDEDSLHRFSNTMYESFKTMFLSGIDPPTAVMSIACASFHFGWDAHKHFNPPNNVEVN